MVNLIDPCRHRQLIVLLSLVFYCVTGHSLIQTTLHQNLCKTHKIAVTMRSAGDCTPLTNAGTNVIQWPTNQIGCIIVQFVKAFTIELTLISYEAIIPMKQLTSQSYNGTHIHAFLFTVSEKGHYNISIRGNGCNVKSMSEQEWPQASLGFMYGRKFQIKTDRVYSISVISPVNTIQAYDHLPNCTFHHEHLLRLGTGNPRWRRVAWDKNDEVNIRRIWYNDTYIWGNDLCVYRTIAPEDLTSRLFISGIKHVRLMGDSITRYMFRNVMDYFQGVTQEWLINNPFVYDAKNKTSNWDGIVFKNITTSPVCYHHLGDSKDCNLIPSRVNFYFESFYPGKNEPRPATSRSEQEWYKIFEELFKNKRTDVIIFNAGLWMYFYRHSLGEIIKITKAMLKLSKVLNVILIWRSTTHSFLRPVDWSYQVNKVAIEILTEQPNVYILDSIYDMTRLRPDRSPDGKHFNFRHPYISDSDVMWRPCQQDSFDNNCLRPPDGTWQPAVGRGLLLVLLNLLYNMNHKPASGTKS